MFFYPLFRYAGVVRFYLNEYILLSCYVFQKFRCELRQIYSFFLFRGFGIMKAAKKINGYRKANNNEQSNNIYCGFKATGHNKKIHRLNTYIKKIIFSGLVKAKLLDVIGIKSFFEHVRHSLKKLHQLSGVSPALSVFMRSFIKKACQYITKRLYLTGRWLIWYKRQ